MSLRVLSPEERELMTPECQSIFLRFCREGSIKREVLERALALLTAQDISGIAPVRANDFLQSLQRVQLAEMGLFHNWYDFQPDGYHSGEVRN